MWLPIGLQIRRIAGTGSATVTLYKGSIITHLVLQGGSIGPLPDGNNSTVTIIGPTSGVLDYCPFHPAWQVVGSDIVVQITGATTYLLEWAVAQ